MTMKKRRSGALRGLAQVGTRKKPDGSSFGDVLESLGDRSFGWGFMLVGFMNMLPLPPGTNMVLGLPILFFAVQMIFGMKALWLPGFITNRVIARKRWRAGALTALPLARPLSRLTRVRLLSVFQGKAERPLGLLLLVTGIVLCLPIPLTGWLPAISLFVTGVGLVEHDGAIVGLGIVIAIAAIAVAVAMVFAIYFGISYAAQ
ncbi:Exopolysaccharide synthesis ExoD [Parvibaculum lavamentivorans DS-1]|uniref:Exopolysaccharide synthesis ExoD n=1 Tax=Parvibaculum lavamentivorans (strain DS-1 / DSM 13023 / NCIMB 13966) TaxID=402881 RepID=A7HV76_PARL1|nr:exopolysaccharide biosynthesis protein [Parvibaculum lavamentivorans]ABS63809.1 Exopolysaccharide synthesis ExoD [Parvibaculum lavamentivorans DS-1]